MLLSAIEARMLSAFFPRVSSGMPGYERESNIRQLLGDRFLSRIKGKTVIDFGCGTGGDAVEIALHGASHVVGVDIREDFLRIARQKAKDAGVEDSCEFDTVARKSADVIISVDAFEHFSDPALVLLTMSRLLKDAGEVLISFGPTWYHPRGGHLFSIFPWAHLVLTEQALITWRSTFKTDGARKFGQVVGGLNQMTISRFEKLVFESPMAFADLTFVPISSLHRFHSRVTREFTTSIVRCSLVRKTSQHKRESTEAASRYSFAWTSGK